MWNTTRSLAPSGASVPFQVPATLWPCGDVQPASSVARTISFFIGDRM
ncbi:MAG: hypothetical protein IJC16_03820 [Rikenellaceae bacterium]|nr:hypothetical protein [Rikenellaceae bacterium]